ncbi:MAG: hypothetical protein GWP10_22370 [Nitrospiraceae bacterium]|nr:hypothetical protein [Nitrospiraceae bacterium]
MKTRINDPRLIIQPLRPRPQPGKQTSGTSSGSFRKLFGQKLKEANGLKFSAHALRRLESRDIQLSGAEHEKLEAAVSQAAEKGANDSLILLNRLAFVVNIPNRTVITAMAQDQMHNGIITNIDSAMIIKN